EIAFRPNLYGILLQRFFRFEREAQDFVIHLNETKSFFGDVPVDCSDSRYRFADEADRIVENVAALQGDLFDVVVVLQSAGNTAGTPDNLTILMREDRLHAWKSEGPGDIDAANSRVRMRAAEDARIKHAGELTIVCIGRFAGDTFQCVDARRRVADRLQRSNGGVVLLSHREPP